MEDVIQRFPNISQQIFENLDVESLVLCREVCQAWKSCIDGEKFYWIRIMMKNLPYLEEKFLMILFRNTYLDIVKNLAEKTIEHRHSEQGSLKRGGWGGSSRPSFWQISLPYLN